MEMLARQVQQLDFQSGHHLIEEKNMTFPSSYSFYVTLMSQVDTDEFPNNHPHHFKNRLPRPIRFVGQDWQVGLVSLPLPSVPAVGENFVDGKDPLLYVRWNERVLREVMYQRKGRGSVYFEPLHFQYMPLRKEVVDIVETLVAETNGDLGVVAGIPKAAWSITKGLETLAKKNAKRAHRKRMVEIRQGKRKSYGGESCSLM